MENEKFLSIREVAEYCEVTEPTVRKWIKYGELPSTRRVRKDADGRAKGIRKFITVKESDLIKLIEDRAKKQITRFENSEGFLTVTQAAELVNVATITLRNWVYIGKLKSYKHRVIDENGKYIGKRKITVVEESEVLRILNESNEVE